MAESFNHQHVANTSANVAKEKFKWQWHCGSRWKDYRISDSTSIEYGYKSKRVVHIIVNGMEYTIDTFKCKQINILTNCNRNIRRIPINHTDNTYYGTKNYKTEGKTYKTKQHITTQQNKNASSSQPKIRWQWLHTTGSKWIDYDAPTSDLLEQKHRSQDDKIFVCRITHHNCLYFGLYSINLATMKQSNMETGKTRDIRRISAADMLKNNSSNGNYGLNNIESALKEIVNSMDLKYVNQMNDIKQILMNKRKQQRTQILYNAKWHDSNKIPILDNKKCSKKKHKANISAIVDKESYKEQYTSIRIPFDVSTIISNNIKEEIPNLYNYMIKSSALHQNNAFVVPKQGDTIRIFNYGFHNKITNDILYCVAEPYVESGYQWKIMDKLFTAKDIKVKWAITENQLPKLYGSNENIKIQLNKQEVISKFIENKQFYEFVMNGTKWEKRDKIPIYNKRNNINRKTLSLTKKEFLKQVKNAPFNQNNVIPILMPDHNGHHIEFVQIVSLQDEVGIGISYKYNEKTNAITPCGIHLDHNFIISQHKLLYPNADCSDLLNCVLENDNGLLNWYRYDHLTIGDPDVHYNNMNRYKNKCHQLTDFVKKSIKYFTKMVGNVANMTTENVQAWIDKARAAMTNNKNGDVSLDLLALFDTKHSSNFEVLMKSPMYMKDLQEINNFYYIQTLNPNGQFIIPHPKHQKPQ